MFFDRRRLIRGAGALGFGVILLAAACPAQAESGYDLWLRYAPIENAERRAAYRASLKSIVVAGRSRTAALIQAELQRGLGRMLGTPVPLPERVPHGAVVVGTPSSSPLVARLGWDKDLAALGDEGYVIRSTRLGGHAATVVASRSEIGALYGTFHFLRLLQTEQPIEALNVSERPHIQRRVLNHWDNLDGTIERGYAGASLWKWDELPGRVDPRVQDYARANASIGINGSVINSVNANPKSLSAAYIEKTAALADALRPYGIRAYLSANFAAPKLLGNLPTADPLDPAVAKWWRDKADEIYARIPDFGGFLVKANSEGQPGPQDYHRTHADGANVLADAVRPHGGVVMYRAFVYDAETDPDRVKRAYKEFVPLDGRFRDNVFVQVKNGPLDFQPREPFHPLFGAMPGTPIMAELQITQEYLGQSTHLVYLAPMWKEFLDADTYARGPGSTAAKVVDGTLEGHTQTGMAGVANTGSDTNWTGHDFAQANWYAFGRLAWDHELTPAAIAAEWIRMTWSNDRDVIVRILDVMMRSREAFVDYTMPLGLHHLIGGDHYAPMPENTDPRRSDWSATTYHRAAADGIGYDRSAVGTNAVGQYRSPLREDWDQPATTPERLLLWFHRMPWDGRMSSGRTLWDELVWHYHHGADEAQSFAWSWAALSGRVDPERHAAVQARLRRQEEEAAQWSDRILRYFQTFSGRPFPSPHSPHSRLDPMTAAPVPEPPFVVVIDVGSSSVRANLYDRRARLVKGSQVAQQVALHTAADGTADEDPLALAVAVEKVVDAVLAKAHTRAKHIAAVGLDTLVFAACGVDAQGVPVTPLYTYADTRARRQAQELRRELDFAEVYQRTGCPLHTSYMPARLRWLEAAHPDLAPRVKRWLPVGSLLYGRWFGTPAVPVSYSVAAWSGLLDRRSLQWDQALLRHLHVSADALPPLADYDRAARGLAPAYARRWPALRDVPFFLAVGDGAAANVGSGCVSPERVALTVGTTGAMRVVLPDATPPVPAGLWAYKVGAKETLLGGALSEGGNVFAWATAALRLPPAARLDAALRALPPDGHGLTILPFVAGERSPGWSNDAEAMMVGIHPATSALQMLQAWLEAVAFRFVILARLLSPHASPTHEIVASGGAMSASPYWVQLMANAIGRRVHLSRSEELTSRGAAILALRGLSLWRSLADEALGTEDVYEPDASRAPVYQAALERQHRLYEKMLGVDPAIGPALAAAVYRR